ncbi:tumor necrosis factor receptor superfamily member 19-like [Hemiscyllium ocellatum]|uniref:tumor necrosis factor receptor superfamily member 19-like n=1 Tax=Hemiscyllium ocellatum TaxID=170820 RepID=UPI00296779EB|nr:tumor necrosis factor receptor superfamily member 19-like [Hemiscyllium ocellatum]
MRPWLELLIFFSLLLGVLTSMRDCQENEYWDVDGTCKVCKECGPGMELSKDCGFGVGLGTECVICGPNRYKDSWGRQKCKLCLSCALVNRIQVKNCTVSRNAVCGKCSPGFYRKTRLGGLPDKECIPCTDPATPRDPQCVSRLDVTRVLSPDTGPYNTALVAVICSVLTTVLLTTLLLCLIYCRKLVAEKQNNGHPRAPVTERARMESSCSEGQVDDASTESLIIHCQKVTSDYNTAQPEAPADVIQSEDAPCTLKSCIVAYFSPSGSQTKGRSAVTCPAFSSSSQNCCQVDTPEFQQLAHTSDCSALCRPAWTSNCEVNGEFLLGHNDDADASLGQAGGEMSHCASVLQYRQEHTPVECTELDLQEYLTDAVAQETTAYSQASRPHEGPTAASCSFGSGPCTKESCMWDRDESRPEECSSSRCGNSEHRNLSTGTIRVGDLENLLNHASGLTQGVHI